MKIKDIVEQFKTELDNGQIICLIDEQNHRSVVAHSQERTCKYVQEYEPGIIPYVYPEPEFSVHGIFPIRAALNWLREI